MVALFAVPSLAWDAPPSPKPQSAILDQSHVLSTEAHARLDAQLAQINQGSANELAALILPSLDGQNIEDVGVATAKAWGVGKKDLDNGVLVVLAMKEHKSRIETGKGVEGDLPDLKCNDILQNTLRPHMRSGDVEGGLKATFSAISTSIANHKADVAAGRSSTSTNGPACDISNGVGAGGDSTMSWLIPLILLGLGMWWVVSSIQRTKRRQQEAMEATSREMDALLRKQEAVARLKEEQDRRKRQEDLKALEASMESSLAMPPTPTYHIPPPATVKHVPSAEETERKRHAEEERSRQREEDARRKRQQEEDDRRRRDSESSSSSSSSSSDWSSGGSSGGGFDSGGGGFGGGDFGGGGSSGDW